MLAETTDAYREKLIELRKELVAEFAKLTSPYKDDNSEAAGAEADSAEKTKQEVTVKEEAKEEKKA